MMLDQKDQERLLGLLDDQLIVTFYMPSHHTCSVDCRSEEMGESVSYYGDTFSEALCLVEQWWEQFREGEGDDDA